MTAMEETSNTEHPSRAKEVTSFLFLTVVLAPAVAVGLVGGYGFAIWIYQIIAGPPGPPVL